MIKVNYKEFLIACIDKHIEYLTYKKNNSDIFYKFYLKEN